MDYYNCDTEYRLNCKNKDTKCKSCIGWSIDNKELLYKPMGKHLEHHPLEDYIKARDKANKLRGRALYRKGRNNEVKIAKEVGIVNPSSKGNDGLIKTKARVLKLEIKTRISENKIWPTKQEWEKFRAKGLDIFIVDVGKGDVRVILSKELFMSLVED